LRGLSACELLCFECKSGIVMKLLPDSRTLLHAALSGDHALGQI
jgi:hypothetical protein